MYAIYFIHAKGGKMVIRHLEILEAIAETGTFTGAAKKLYITQSAVSHAVAERRFINSLRFFSFRGVAQHFDSLQKFR